MAAAQAQQPAPGGAAAEGASQARGRVLGEVLTVDASARRITLKTAGGQSAGVTYDDKTLFRRVPAGETTLDKAVPIAPGEVGVGDRVIARGAAEGDSLMARSLIVVSQADIAQKRQREREEWKRRGVAGVVTALNPATKEITLRLRSRPGGDALVVAASGGVRFRRYAPDSVRFADAVEGSFEGLKVGDQLRALGSFSPDGARFVPEEIVSGTFRMAGGTITSVNAAAGEIVINDIQSQRPLTVVLNKDSMMRRLTPELLEMLERQASAPAGAAITPAGAQGPSVQEKVEALPPITAADLKPGDAVLVSSVAGANPSRATAVMLAAGVEPYLKKQQKQATRPGFTLDLVLPGAF
jgi:hypothetical protein